MLLYSYNRMASTNAALNGTSLPTSPTSGFSHWHLRDALGYTSAEDVAEVRFYCTIAYHSRVVHFKTANAHIRGVAVSGDHGSDNSAADWTSGWTALSGHSAYLPAGTVAVGQGSAAFYEHPFQGGSYHWTIRSGYSECDNTDTTGADAQHQVWIRLAESHISSKPIMSSAWFYGLNANSPNTLAQLPNSGLFIPPTISSPHPVPPSFPPYASIQPIPWASTAGRPFPSADSFYGISNLLWNLGDQKDTLSTVAIAFASRASDIAIFSGIAPHLYNFLEGTTGTCIVDGGDDMYDCGNQISVKATGFGYSGILSYRQSPESFLAGSGDVTYTTYKSSAYPFVWLAVFDSASDGIEGFRVTGNNGADGSGAASWGALGVSSVNPNFYGWYKKVYGAGDPSINHLVIAKGSSNWTQSANSYTDSDQHTLQKNGEEKTTRLYYLLFAGRYGHDFEPNSFGSVMDAFLDACEVDHGTIPA
mmetsp:Transcript_29958/g.56517  ORF Transcript_29958/g.56517 Transcript_29958/m.56517 type:complete len:476 (+) Transcript_29958:2-1429(+)